MERLKKLEYICARHYIHAFPLRVSLLFLSPFYQCSLTIISQSVYEIITVIGYGVR
jgi:hypothetical protein